ncbi:aldo/keto reductase [Arenibaculum pallidiluteum]|uniref:aldo/keto reductase n=1 Tax=Arenibaculum pallidiluteum TaxID=2812559 RepID=UPI001A97939C|nr:aldo/keto reductase [Arenibaculum pallidiluteum]
MPDLSTTRAVSLGRREFIRAAAGTGALLAIPASSVPGARIARAQQSAPSQAGSNGLAMRAIPRTGEMIPAVGLGTFMTFDIVPGQPRTHLRDVIRTYWEAGARVIDTSPLYGTAESTVGDFVTSLGINDQIFVANKIWSTGEFLADESHARRSLEQSQNRLWRERIDLLQCHSLVNVDAVVPTLRAWKKEGRIKYLGVTHHDNAYHDVLASWVERDVLDFVQVNYSIYNRGAEQRVLRAAADRGIAVLVNMPLEKARLHKVVEGLPLPDFAADIGATTWSQFFLKWILGNPNVTCVLPSTSNPQHAAENAGALRGPLPDQDMRARMVRHMESIPGFHGIGEMPWYPDKRYAGVINRSLADTRARA